MRALSARSIVIGKKTEGVGETRSLADALCHHSNRGVSGQPRCARHTMTRTGPYDAILGKHGRRSRSVKLELLLLLSCFLPTFSHCCPPSHETWRMSASVRSGIDTHCIPFTTAQ